MDPRDVVLYPLMTESTTRLVEKENRLVFIVNVKASKTDVRMAIEDLYEVKVGQVNFLITPRGEKKAYVRLLPEYKAADLAIKLGIL